MALVFGAFAVGGRHPGRGGVVGEGFAFLDDGGAAGDGHLDAAQVGGGGGGSSVKSLIREPISFWMIVPKLGPGQMFMRS